MVPAMARARSATEITSDILLQAYAVGIFPMADSADDDRLFWVEPERRGVFPLDGLRISRSLAKLVRAERFAVRHDQDFGAVIAGCAAATPDRPSTWISGRIHALFEQLWRERRVHTVEAYADGQLVGGLYGLRLGGAFFGESMFHRATDASKVCLVHLAARLRANGFGLLDAQFVTPHLASLGAVEISRAEYRRRLGQALAIQATLPSDGTDERSGAAALAVLRHPGDNDQSRSFLP